MAKILPHYNSDMVVLFDVDDTLTRYQGTTQVTHHRHVDLLKQFYLRGHHILVWSAGGKPWADYIVNLLGLEDFVHETMTKPRWYVDDKPADKWMERVFIEEEGFYGRTVGSNEEVRGDTKTSPVVSSTTPSLNYFLYTISPLKNKLALVGKEPDPSGKGPK